MFLPTTGILDLEQVSTMTQVGRGRREALFPPSCRRSVPELPTCGLRAGARHRTVFTLGAPILGVPQPEAPSSGYLTIVSCVRPPLTAMPRTRMRERRWGLPVVPGSDCISVGKGGR